MGSGLSMASVNKIKELANAREYGLALDILESQDLTKSLNPQFLRLCGEIYIYNKRYKEARHILLMAHKLAPEAKRIIYTIMFLYLKMGYMDLAKRYYDIYMSDADETVLETKQVVYIYNKATKHSLDDIEQYITPSYSNTMDYEWTYETILIYLMQNRDKEAEALIHLYGATYKGSEHDISIQNIVDGKADVRDMFDTFAEKEQTDDDPEQEPERVLERMLLEADDLRINPPEPEIVIMVDDNDDDEIVSKRKLKKMLKEQERKEKEAVSENMSDDIENNENTQADKVSEEDITEPVNEDAGENIETQPEDEQIREKKKFIKNIFSKVRRKDNSEEKTSDDEPEVTDAATEEQIAEDSVQESEAENAETEAYKQARHIFFGEEDSETAVTDVESENSDSEETESELAYGDNDMREIHIKERNSIKKPVVMIDMGDDDFTAESDTIENLHDSEEFANPFDSIVVAKGDEASQGYKIKKSISFETVELADEDEDAEFDVDDFSSWDSEDDEFGEMSTAESDIEEAEAEAEPEPEAEDEAEEIEEAEAEAEPEPEVEDEPEEIEEAEAEAEPEPEVEDEPEEIEETEAEEAYESEYDQDLDSLFKIPPKKKLDYPVFKSSLFPDYHNDEPEIENNFGDILQEAQDKIHENILKEEEMQREAEALLASLGIDLGNISVTSDHLEDLNETINEGPSRDELKASLKINSVQREVLNKLKEYR